MIQVNGENPGAVKTRSFNISNHHSTALNLQDARQRGKYTAAMGDQCELKYVFTLNASRCSWNTINDSSRSGMFLWACRGNDASLALSFSSLWNSAILSQCQNQSARLVHLLKTAQLLFIAGGRGLYSSQVIFYFCFLFQMSNSCSWNM